MSTECLAVDPKSSQEDVCVLSAIIPLHTLRHISPPRLPNFIRNLSSLHNVHLDLVLSFLHICVARKQSRPIDDSTVHRCLRVTLSTLTSNKRYARLTLQIMQNVTLFTKDTTIIIVYAFILAPGWSSSSNASNQCAVIDYRKALTRSLLHRTLPTPRSITVLCQPRYRSSGTGQR
jgi:hypothetical protein